MVTITENAKKKIEELLLNDKFDNTYFLRVGVNGSGCAGLSYKMEFDNTLIEGDEVFEDKGVKIVSDKKSLLYIWGTELDFSDGLNGKGFVWNNPSASRTCGCGSSFSV
jgi:iron-sulfur cluster assembly protein